MVAVRKQSASKLLELETLLLKPENLQPLPTPSLPIVVVGADEPAGIALLKHILDNRESVLHILECAAFVAVVALIGREGAVYPASRQAAADSLRPTASTPYGGLSQQVLGPLLASNGGANLHVCPGYQHSPATARASHRRLGPALRMAAAPSMVIVDVSSARAAETYLSHGETTFSLERYGGVSVLPPQSPVDEPSTVIEQQSEAMWHAILRSFRGWLTPLVPPPLGRRRLDRCVWCAKKIVWPAEPRACAGCEAACYCSVACQLADLSHDQPGSLCHAAYCPTFRASSLREVRVSLPGNPSWLTPTCDCATRLYATECEVLSAIGCHRPPYTLFCRCTPDNLVAQFDLEGQLALACELSGSLPVIGDEGVTSPIVHSWAEYYAFRGIEPASPIALILSFALTVYHAIVLCCTRGGAVLAGSDDVIVCHCLGAASREAALEPTFAELTVLLPATKLRLVLIGPDAPSGSGETRRTEGRHGGWLEVIWQRGLYEDIDLQPPSLAVACNSGIFEYDSWQPTIAVLEEHSTPFVFTDYSEMGLVGAAVAIREHHGLRLSLPITLNPFRQPLDRGSMLPGLEGAVGIPWIGNGFLTAVLLSRVPILAEEVVGKSGEQQEGEMGGRDRVEGVELS